MSFIEDMARRNVDLANRPFLSRWRFPIIAIGVPSGIGLLMAYQKDKTGYTIFILVMILVAYFTWIIMIRASREYLKHYGDGKEKQDERTTKR